MTEQGPDVAYYLGDGLWASYDGYQVKLRAPRERGDHEVFLEESVLIQFFKFIEDTHGCVITVKKKSRQ